VWDAARGGYRKPPPECINGVSDLIAFRRGETVFIECKTDDGELSDDQKLFRRQCEKHEIRYVVARGIEDLEELR
jgi:hypothetical protein